MSHRPELSIAAPGASPVQAAAIVAAIDRFVRDTTPAPGAPPARLSPWLEASLLEGVARQPDRTFVELRFLG